MDKVWLIIKITSYSLMIGYPFIIFFGMNYFSLTSITLMIITIGGLRYLSSFAVIKIEKKIDTEKRKFNATQILMILSITLAAGAYFFQSLNWMLFYPVLVNVTLFIYFSYSLLYPPSIIERFARLKDKELPDEAILYTKNVTKIWCVFFIINGSIALFTIFNIKYWVLYNGLISYILIGLLLSGEYLYRILKVRHSA